jgi:hypothetical protein
MGSDLRAGQVRSFILLPLVNEFGTFALIVGTRTGGEPLQPNPRELQLLKAVRQHLTSVRRIAGMKTSGPIRGFVSVCRRLIAHRQARGPELVERAGDSRLTPTDNALDRLQTSSYRSRPQCYAIAYPAAWDLSDAG